MARMYLVELSDDNRETWSCVAVVTSFEEAVNECESTVGMHNDLNNFFGLAPEKRINLNCRIIRCEVKREKEIEVHCL